MFTVLTVMAAETLRECGLRAGFCKTTDAARPNQTFEEGHTHVCILRGVTRATLIFLLDLLNSESDSSPSVSETESDSQSHSLTVTDGDGHSTRCHRPPPDAIHATMYFMLLHRSVNSR